MLGMQSEEAPGVDEWSAFEVVWPHPRQTRLSDEIPSPIKESLKEAHLCLEAGANLAAAVMAGRAVEGICRHHKTQKHNLLGGLVELKDRGIIEGRLFQWSQELHWYRNVGAHAGPAGITPRDARDLVDFALAICNYVFALTAKYEDFIRRHESARTDSDPRN
jgi:hypothetical protein